MDLYVKLPTLSWSLPWNVGHLYLIRYTTYLLFSFAQFLEVQDYSKDLTDYSYGCKDKIIPLLRFVLFGEGKFYPLKTRIMYLSFLRMT